MASLESDIELLFGYFNNLLNSIIDVNFKVSDDISKSILLCSLIDTLSSIRYSKLPNRERFISFIDDFSGWSNVNRISLVQLHYFIKDENDKNYEPIKTFLKVKMSKMRSGTIYLTDFDDYLHNLNYLKVIEEQINCFSYANLLYKFRNYLIHEFRTPGLGSNFIKSDAIHYYSLTEITGKGMNHSWELVFPVNYLYRLVSDCIKNIKEYCLINKINPYDYYEFDSRWLKNSEVKKKKKT